MDANLAFGLNAAVPDEVKTAWGARLIAPDDILWDRQDLQAENDEEKAALIAWLNGTPEGNGAIARMREWLRDGYRGMGQDREAHVLYEDDDGIIRGSTNASYGYVYCAGWLKPDRLSAEDREALREIRRETPIGRMHDALTVEKYKVKRMPITTERWHTHYGWSEAEAAKFGEHPNSTEVRIFALYADGTEREITDEKLGAGCYEFGYGGSGPHETARAIVADRGQWDLSPARLKDLVPEVFAPTGRESVTITVIAADVDGRVA